MIRDQYVLVKDLLPRKDDPSADGMPVRVRGWVKTNRGNAHVGFLAMSDGSCFENIQIVYNMDEHPELAPAAKISTGSSIDVTGRFVLTPEARQPFEVQAEKIVLLGDCDSDFPMQKKRHSLEFLREVPHLRPRTNTFNALFRVRSVLCGAIHEFFQTNGFLYITPPLITGNDAEGAGEVFTVTTGEGKETDFFGKKACLTVSGQLHVEPFALAYDRVYTFGPTFRAENSNTTTHASEFWMVEPEIAFADLEDDMACMEAMVKYCITKVLERCPSEMAFFNEMFDPEHRLIERLTAVANSEFKVMTYTEAIDLLKASGRDFQYPVEWGVDLKTEHERYICEEVVQ